MAEEGLTKCMGGKRGVVVGANVGGWLSRGRGTIDKMSERHRRKENKKRAYKIHLFSR